MLGLPGPHKTLCVEQCTLPLHHILCGRHAVLVDLHNRSTTTVSLAIGGRGTCQQLLMLKDLT